MGRSIKVFFIVFALLLIALLAFVVTFDAENYRPQIIAQVEKITGRDFSIDGEIRLSVFPWVGLKVEKVALGNEKGFSAQSFAVIRQLDVRLKLIPLLKKEVQISTVRLHGLHVSLEVARDKSNNWSGLVRSQSAEEAVKTPADETAGDMPPLAALLVEGFEVLDARIDYDDRSTDTRAAISEVRLVSSEIRFDQPVDIEFSGHVENRQPQLDSRIRLDSQLVFNRELSEFNLQGCVIKVQVKANEFIPGDEQLEIRSDVHVSMAEQRITIEPLELLALDTTTRAALDISQFLQSPLIQGDIEVLPFDARAVAARAGVSLPAMAAENSLQRVALTSDINMQGERLEANNINLSLDNSILSGWLHILNLGQQQLRYDLALDKITLDDYLPPAVADAGSDKAIAAAPAKSADEAAAGGDEKIALPVEMLRQLDLQGDFRIGSMTALQYDIANFNMHTSAHKGVIKIEPLSMLLLDGQLSSALSADVAKAVPAYTMKLDARQLQAGPMVNPFLVGIMGEEPLTMQGAVNLTMDVNTTGETVNQLKSRAKGNIVLDMDKTRVDGFDPEYYMRSSVASYVDSKGVGLSKNIMGDYQPRKVTVFDRIHGTVRLADGKARTSDFIMDSKRVMVKAEGFADVMQNSLDVTSSVALPRGKTSLEKLLDAPLYVRIHGPFTALQYEIDTDRLKKSTTDVLEKEAKAKAEEKLEAEKLRLQLKAEEEKLKAEQKAKEELRQQQDKLKDELKNKLKGLF